MRNFKKKCCGAVAALMACVTAVGCGGAPSGGSNVTVPDLDNGYSYSKQNNEGLMQFYSSDAGLDSFINEYMERHLRYSDKSIGDLKVGNGNTVWKEWEAMSVMWMNTAGIGYSPKESIGNWFTTVPQDEFGYIWMDSGLDTAANWGQSWQFPNMAHSGNGNSKEYYNTSYFNGLNNMAGPHTGSNELTSIWKGASNNGNNGTLGKNTTDYYDYMLVKGNDMKNITFTYETPQASKDAATREEQLLVAKPYMGTPYCSPFLELDLSITDVDSLGSADQVEDVTVYWKGGSGQKNTDWDDDHMVAYSGFTSNPSEKFQSTSHIVFPMYAHRNWGSSESVADAVTDMKIVVTFKNGINAEVKLEEVTLSFDGRQVNNNSVFLAAAAYYFQYTQDTVWLEANLPKIRRALQFLLTYCKGETQQLITVENFIGHDGSSNYDYFAWKDENGNPGNFTNTGTGHGIGDGYWDCPSYPMVNLYTNLYYYKALASTLYLEQMAASAKVTADPVSVKTAAFNADVSYAQTDKTIADKIAAFVPKFQEYFWNEETGRFHLGYLSPSDKGVIAGVLTEKVDYGFTTYNQEAIELGLATPAQEKSILSWINGERVVAGDTADNSNKTTKSIYYYQFAPRWTTKENRYQFWFRFDGNPNGKYAWNKQVQNGGTAAQCAYYDIKAEDKVNGSDAAFAKLKNMQVWYDKVAERGGVGANFYRAYYGKLGIALQGGKTEGVIGLDYEFIEAAVVPTVIPTVFFGLGSTEYKTLNITPNLPESLSFWKMENLMYAGVEYDLTIGKDFVQINSVSGNAAGMKLKVVLDAPSGAFSVRQHNNVLAEGKDYVVQNGKIIVTVPFQNGRIQIVK